MSDGGEQWTGRPDPLVGRVLSERYRIDAGRQSRCLGAENVEVLDSIKPESKPLKIVATCVRVPVPIGHSESVIIETSEALEPDDVRTILGTAPGVIVADDPASRIYPTPNDVAGKDEVYVGRIRKDLSSERGIALWLVSDNLRKGAALNAVQIAEKAIEMGVLTAGAARRGFSRAEK